MTHGSVEAVKRCLPRLLAVTDLSAAPAERWLAQLQALATQLRPGALAILLRDHGVSGRERLEFGRELRSLTRTASQELWVADRLDLALLLGAEGLHLGERSARADAVRPFWRATLTRAWHLMSWSAEQGRELIGVDALLVSPVLAPRKGRAALGPAALGELGSTLRAQSSGSVPVLYALGGVTAETAASCVAAGAHGVAAIGAALHDSPAALADALGARR